MRLNKRGVTELVSFVLILLLIVVASSSAYVFSDKFLTAEISKFDLNSIKMDFNEMNYLIDLVQVLDSSSSSIDVSFKSGILSFENNQVRYQSLVPASGDLCINVVCYRDNNGFEETYFNLSNSYSFNESLNLSSGNYIITFKNLKNVSKIKIYIKKE